MNYKTLKKLTQKKHRLEMGLCLIEGEKLVREHKNNAIAVFERGKDLSEKDFDTISNLGTPQNVLAVIPIPKNLTKNITFPYLVLDGIQDPGNVGTLLRTALAFGFNTVFTINSADTWSQKVIRSAMGAQFHLNIVQTTLEDFTPQGILYIADSNTSNNSYPDIKNGANFGLVLGNEGNGISSELKKHHHETITIPMKNSIDSLNVAVAGGIIMNKLMN